MVSDTRCIANKLGMEETLKVMKAIQEENEEMHEKRKALDAELERVINARENGGLFMLGLWLLLNTFIFRPIFAWMDHNSYSAWKCVEAEKPVHSSGLEVIVASPNDWHAVSLQVALESLGLRTYKDMETGFYLHDLLERNASASSMAGAFKACRVGALMPSPRLDLVPDLIAASPGIKVIIAGSDWHRWSAWMRREMDDAAFHGRPHSILSVTASLFFCHWLPLSFLFKSEDPRNSFVTNQMSSLLIQHCIVWQLRSHDTVGSLGDMVENITSFHKHVADVRSLVPPERLLEFDYRKHGLVDLAAFVERPNPTPGTPFPEVSINSSSPEFAEIALFPLKFLLFWVAMITSMALNWFAFAHMVGIVWRALARRKHEKSD